MFIIHCSQGCIKNNMFLKTLHENAWRRWKEIKIWSLRLNVGRVTDSVTLLMLMYMDEV